MNRILDNIYLCFDKDWWQYILSPPAIGVSRITAICCRWRGHAGVHFYNPGGLEPDMRCTRCHDNLG